MHCRRRRYVLVLTACCVCISLWAFSFSLLPDEQTIADIADVAPRERVVINGQRDILNVANQPVSLVATLTTKLVTSASESQPKSLVPAAITTVKKVGKTSEEVQDDCRGPWKNYPRCEEKMKWMAEFWKVDPCYSTFGVDGTACSFQNYLSVVEKWCPPLKHFKHISSDTPTTENQQAIIQYELEPLLVRLSVNSKFDWISRRIKSSWEDWTAAMKRLLTTKNYNVSQKSILIHIGALTDKAGFKFAENADHGGPLGELVQWSDLIASLYLLGHKIRFSSEVDQLHGFLDVKKGVGGCPTRSEKQFDIIYIDIVGLKQFKKIARQRLQHYECMFRVLDSFGTEPQFNFRSWKPPRNTHGVRREYGQTWGNWQLNPRQFLTMYPHTPDNSFLGFVVRGYHHGTSTLVKKNMSLIYGKELYMWKEKRPYLDLVSRYFDVHATIGTTFQKGQQFDMSIIPGFVHNHGILNASALHSLLREAKVFVGLGFPYEGPAPLEAISNGCAFINPRISPPINRDNSKFLKGKPTLRSLDSQNPYTEMFIGQPYVYTVNIDNRDEVLNALKAISTGPSLAPYLPYEFTFEGMLERVAVLLEKQNFCQPHQWPPISVLETRVSRNGESCKDACYREGLVCEPELFGQLNSENALKQHNFSCAQTFIENSVHGPSFDTVTHKCSLQQHKLLLTCVGSDPSVMRLCPCRTYRKGQVALCERCTL